MRHVLKHAPERHHCPREVVAKSLRCRKSGQFGGSSFLHVSPIAIIEKIVHRPDAFFCPFAQERLKILIRPHGCVPRKRLFLSGGLISKSGMIATNSSFLRPPPSGLTPSLGCRCGGAREDNFYYGSLRFPVALFPSIPKAPIEVSEIAAPTTSSVTPHTRIDREALKRLAEKEGRKPLFLFPERRR
jgi:hypothetical protein